MFPGGIHVVQAGGQHASAVQGPLAKFGLAMLVLGLTLWLGMGSEQGWLSDSGWRRVWRMTGLVAMGMSVYIAVLWLLGFRLKDFSRREA